MNEIPQIEWEQYVAVMDMETRIRKGLKPDDGGKAWRIARDLRDKYGSYELELRYTESLNQLKEEEPELYEELT